MKTIAAGLAVLVLAASVPCRAQDCPTAETVGRGFLVERASSIKTEVRHLDDAMVQTTWRSGNAIVLQTMQFQGVFELDRLEGGRRTVFRPKTSLAGLFPLEAGKAVAAEFETGAAGQTLLLRIVLAVKETASMDIGPCKLDVLRIERSVAQGGATPENLYTEFYAPLLKLVIGKEFSNGDGTTTRTQYDRISSR